MAYSEKTESLELICETAGHHFNPLESDHLPDEIGLNLVRNFASKIDFIWENSKNTLKITIKK